MAMEIELHEVTVREVVKGYENFGELARLFNIILRRDNGSAFYPSGND